jgi:hypothetical protein
MPVSCSSYSIGTRFLRAPSRGIIIIPALLAESDQHMAERRIATFALDHIQPFRLVGNFPINEEGQVRERRWDGDAAPRRPGTWPSYGH